MASLRSQFPFFDGGNPGAEWVYLDSAATSHKPRSVIDAIDRYYTQQNANVHRGSYALASDTTGAFEQARQRVAQFIGAPSAANIVWTRGATEGINIVASGLARLPELPGNRILIAASEHHANIVPWQRLAKSRDMEIDVIPLDADGRLDVAAGIAMIGAQTAVLAIAQVSNALGNIHPIDALLERARSHSVITLIDGAQSVAHLPVNVEAMGCDFFVFSGHKAYGPTGIGALYGKQAWLESLPPIMWGGEMVETVSFTDATFQPAPLKFEGGTPNIAGAIGLAEALSFIEHNRARLTEREHTLYQLLVTKLREIEGLRLWGDLQDTIATQSFTLEGIDNQDLGMLLSQRKVALRVGHHCAMPLMDLLGLPGTMRVSLACYNTEQDIDRFTEALTASIDLLKQGQQGSEGLPARDNQRTRKSPLADAVRGAKGWDDMYRHIMLAGKGLSRLPVEKHTQDNQVYGCESTVFLSVVVNDNQVSLEADSPSKIVRGLMALVFEPLQGLSPRDVSEFDVAGYLTDLGLARHLSESRGNGLSAVVARIKSRVAQL